MEIDEGNAGKVSGKCESGQSEWECFPVVRAEQEESRAGRVRSALCERREGW